MLVHDQLPPLQKLTAQLHVTFCATCRTRLIKMEGASRLLADTIRGQDLRQWRLPSPQGAVAAARIATAWFSAVIVLLILILSGVTYAVYVTPHPTSSLSTPHQTTSNGGCRPDLPSDKCH